MSIPTISVTVELPASEAGRIATAYCATRGYGPTSGEDAVRYVRETILADLYRQTLEYEAGLAAAAARDTVFANVNDPLVILPDPAPAGPTGNDDDGKYATGPTGPAGSTGSTAATGGSA